MKTLTQHLTQYAGYHRDRRNLATHFAGIPLIVAGLAVLLSRPGLPLGGLELTPALVLGGAAVAYYLLLDIGFGLFMAGVLALVVALGHWAAAQSTALWLAIGVGGFVVGWALQFVGHHYEGRKPAFVDDIMGLLIGPLFLLAEACFALGWRADLRGRIEARVGPLRG